MADYLGQLILHGDQIPQAPRGIIVERDHHVDVTVRTEVVAQYGAKEQELSNSPLPTERRRASDGIAMFAVPAMPILRSERGTVPNSAVNLAGVVIQRVREFSRYGEEPVPKCGCSSRTPHPTGANRERSRSTARYAKSLCGLGIYANTPSTLAPGVAVNQMGY